MSSLPCSSTYRSERCPPLSDSDSNVGEQNETDLSYDAQDEADVQGKPLKQPDCLHVDRQSVLGTRIDSIAKLETNADQLQHQIDEFKQEKQRVQDDIHRKKQLLIDAILKVVDFEISIQDMEALIADKLHHFHSRIIDLESKRMEIFLNSGDPKIHELLELEIEEVKNEFEKTSKVYESNRDEITQHAQTFAATLGDVIKEYHSYFDEMLSEMDPVISHEVRDIMMNEFNFNFTQLHRLMNRPAKFCKENDGDRYFLDINKDKIFKVDEHSSEYKLTSQGDREKIKEGFKLESDGDDEFYFDLKLRKIYTKYFFQDEFGRFFIDVHGTRHYKTDPEASEYMLINGNWKKTKSGTYETDERGLRIKPAEPEVLTDEQVFELTEKGLAANMKNDDLNYIRETVGPAIRKGLAAVVLHQPADPIDYFTKFLIHYHYNQQMFKKRDEELKYFLEMRQKMKKEKGEE